MPKEIERKFHVASSAWRPASRSVHCRQGYLASRPDLAVRVRVMDGQATLTIKQSIKVGVRDEFEYPIPLADGEEFLARFCQGHPIEKIRHYVEYEGMTWEIDEFEGVNAGLVVAEVEMETEGQEVVLPPWVGEEITADPRFLNANLAQFPYGQW